MAPKIFACLEICKHPARNEFNAVYGFTPFTVFVLQANDGRLKGIGVMKLKEKLDRGDKTCLLDVRTPGEFDLMRLGIGETLIPVGELRHRLADCRRIRTGKSSAATRKRFMVLSLRLR